MERRQFIDEVIAEPTSTFEKATKLRKVGVCFRHRFAHSLQTPETE